MYMKGGENKCLKHFFIPKFFSIVIFNCVEATKRSLIKEYIYINVKFVVEFPLVSIRASKCDFHGHTDL